MGAKSRASRRLGRSRAPARRSTIVVAHVAAYGMAAVAGGILAYTGVSVWQDRGGDTGPAAAGTSASARPSVSVPAAPDGPSAVPTPRAGSRGGTAPPPAASAAQLRSLAGTWLSYSRTKDYLVFTTAGRGAWKIRNRTLWQGRVIPAGPYTFHLAWQGTGHGKAAYWEVRLIDGGRKLIFNGTRQQYLKIRRHASSGGR